MNVFTIVIISLFIFVKPKFKNEKQIRPRAAIL